MWHTMLRREVIEHFQDGLRNMDPFMELILLQIRRLKFEIYLSIKIFMNNVHQSELSIYTIRILLDCNVVQLYSTIIR